MPTEIWCALISGIVTLITAIGTWHFSAKKDREKTRNELEKVLLEYYEKNRNEINIIRNNDLREIRDDQTDMGANLQQQISSVDNKLAIIENNLNLYSQKVDKHNNVIERVYHLEDADKLLDERIKVANNRILDLEHKVG